MKTVCRYTERVLASEPGLEDHLRECERCRAQAGADSMLREALSDPPDLTFSEGFEIRLRRRVSRRVVRRLTAGRRVALGAYATAAVLATVWILQGVEWPDRMSAGPLGVVVFLIGLVFPLLLLPRLSPFRLPGSELS